MNASIHLTHHPSHTPFISHTIIIDLLSNLDTGKSTGIDGIGASHLKSAKNEIAP